jgi:hypothetical protein
LRIEAGSTDPAFAALDGSKSHGPAFQTPVAAHKPKKKAAHFCTAPFHVD